MAHESHGQHDTELAAFLHRDEQVARTQQLGHMIRDLLTEGVDAGALRDDVAPEELAGYCLHALAGARPSKAASAGSRRSLADQSGAEKHRPT